MDVLKPELIWVDGRCYRFFESEAWINKSNMDSYVEEDYQADYTDEESFDLKSEIVPHGETKFKISFHVPKPFFPFIVGSKNAVRKRIEIETKTSIQVPKSEQDGDIVIIGSDHRGILTARRRIDLIVEVSRKKLTSTHFLCIPLNVEGIIEHFNSFKSHVIEKYGGITTGIEDIIFQKASKLHLTLGMLTLLDEGERKQAVQTLMDCKQHVIDPFIEQHGLFTIQIKGVDCMNDDPSAVKVLYGIVLTENDVLQELSNRIVDYFAEKELMAKRSKDVKLHATFMNISYRKDNPDATTDQNINQLFDATQIMKEYKDRFFGKTVLKEIHLSQRKTATEKNFYQATAKITLG
ncbi:PREDICTED: activating signal cointegrator 1 complex subunit 1-like [Polistes dominula]|uniref:Activating signal cointegrator 1 complex subunit 1-like n=1 Tax=Polistes dominula TaxID=743375 RepID=A0ABM1JFU6_POLDO|nr:PREDICTED: activating signal cointegrator 1 complex subunit 1-like [Polistes dominula]